MATTEQAAGMKPIETQHFLQRNTEPLHIIDVLVETDYAKAAKEEEADGRNRRRSRNE